MLCQKILKRTNCLIIHEHEFRILSVDLYLNKHTPSNTKNTNCVVVRFKRYMVFTVVVGTHDLSFYDQWYDQYLEKMAPSCANYCSKFKKFKTSQIFEVSKKKG